MKDPGSGRWRATTAVYESILPRGLREVALACAYFANEHGRNVWPSVGRLARMVGCSGRNVQFARADLNRLRVLVIEANPGGRQKTSRFRLDLERLAALTPADLAALADHKQQQRRTATGNPETRFTVSSTNPEAGFRVCDPETLKPATRNPETGGPKPRNQRPETLKPTSPDPLILDPEDRSVRTPAPRASDLLGEVVDVIKREGNGADLRAGFDSFWHFYPRKTAKGEAWRAWQKLKPDAGLLATMCAALEWQRRQANWLRDGGRFVPFPATWLRASRWLDEPSETPRISERTLALAQAGKEFCGDD